MAHALAIGASRLVIAATLLGAGAAWAAPAEETGASNYIEDILVTAQRRSERLQEVPVAVTAFTESTIRNLNLNDSLSITKFVPSMISQHNAGLSTANAYYMRGLGNSTSTATFDPPVGTYVDDIYVARQNANNYAFFDVERVEVLRGPQGTLFGRNTTGGAISMHMRKPAEEFGGRIEATGGSFDRYTIKGTVDTPISDKLLTKFSAFYVTDGGYLKNIATGENLNGEESWGLRADVRYLASPDLTIDLAGEYTYNSGTYLGMRSNPVPSDRFGTAYSPVFYETNINMPVKSCDSDPITAVTEGDAGLCMRTDGYALSGKVNWDTEAGNLQFLTGWRQMKQGYVNNYAGNSGDKYTGYLLADGTRNYQISGELKWSGELGEQLKYVAGAYYLRESNHLQSADFSGNGTEFALQQDRKLHQQVDTVAAYLQADYEIIENLTITAGARYTWEVKNLEFFKSERFPGLGFDSEDVLEVGIPLRMTESRVTPRLAVNYKIDDNSMVFASVTNGFKSGGWNGASGQPWQVLPFRPETTWSYEAGFKTELFDRQLRLNGNFYLADTNDLQITSGIIIPPQTTIVSLARNAGELRAYGFEWETMYQPSSRFSIFANGSLNKGKYLSTVLTPGVPDNLQVQTSTVPVRVPTFQLSSGMTYKLPVEDLDGVFGFTAAYRHNSSYYIALLNTAMASPEDFVDLNLTYENNSEKWGLAFGVTNLTKQETVTANFLSLFPGDPRRFTGRLWFRF